MTGTPGGESPAADAARDPRRAAGSPVFVAASFIDQRVPELTFTAALALARLVLIHGGGPVPRRGKGAVMDGPTVKLLTRLGLVQQAQEGSVEAVYHVQSTSTAGRWTPRVNVVGSRDKSGWIVLATDEGRDLVRSAAGAHGPTASAGAADPAPPD